MFGSYILEAAIGLVFIYILLSLLCSVLNEWIIRMQSLRADVLRKQVMQLLGTKLGQRLTDHPLIQGMCEEGKRFPQYIPQSTFAQSLIQIGYFHTPGRDGLPGKVVVLRMWDRDQTPLGERRLLEALRQDSTNIASLQARIEKWFELAMEQASGRFKRRVQIYTLVFAGLIVGGGNVDTIAIFNQLYNGAAAGARTAFPLGWNGFAWTSIPGILVSWGAISLGAPFWFELLNKLVNLRQTGLPPDEDKRSRNGRFVA